jgi:FKBP-type peptidyl-prolyl cis-trans isomerase FklB
MMAALAAGVFTVSIGAADAKTELTTPKQKYSYSIGVNMGRQMKQAGVEIDFESLVKGAKDAMTGNPALSDTEIQEAMMNLQKDVMAKASERGEKAKKEGDDFLAANKSKEGVKTIPGTALQYKVMKEGKGPKPKATDKVSTHYRGTLVDGTEFDSSYKRGEPTDFGVTEVISGWTTALTNMNVGSKWQLFIPSDMAYGPEGRPPVIPPNSALIFEMELLAIKGPDSGAPGLPTPK